MITAHLENAEQIGKQLAELERKTERRIISKGIRAGGKVWRDSARAEAPENTGLLKSQIKVRAGKRKQGSISVNVGASAKDFTGTAFYASFIEYGFRIGKRELGNARKQQPANPFLKRAFDNSHEDASNKAIEVIREGIEKATKGGT